MTETASGAWEATAMGLRVFVRLTPKAARDGIDGLGRLSDGRAVVLARVRAVPDKGEANKALCALFSNALKLPKAAVRLESGTTARLKTLGIDGDATMLAARLTALCAESARLRHAEDFDLPPANAIGRFPASGE